MNFQSLVQAQQDPAAAARLASYRQVSKHWHSLVGILPPTHTAAPTFTQAAQQILQQYGGNTSANTISHALSLNTAYQDALAVISATAMQYKILMVGSMARISDCPCLAPVTAPAHAQPASRRKQMFLIFPRGSSCSAQQWARAS